MPSTTIRNTPRHHASTLLDLGRRGLFRASDLAPHGIPRTYLTRLVRSGEIERAARGVYFVPNAELSPQYGLAVVAKRIPHGVVCLLSALRYHDLTTQASHQVWLAITARARLPKLDYPPLRVVRFPSAALVSGVSVHTIGGVEVRITDPARTVADCFAYRHKIGVDVALEALRDCLAHKRATPDQILTAAKSRRVGNVIRPYLEAVLT